MIDPHSFDPVWEEKYAAGHAQRAPWDAVVSFVFRNAPRNVPREQVRILEVGCGTASNLWFAAREGFSVVGVEASASAIETARTRFAQDKLRGDLHQADFTQLPIGESSCDLVVDRGAITCVGLSAATKALAEVRRVLKPGGRFFFNPYSDRHSSAASGVRGVEGITSEISEGSMVGVGQIAFYGRSTLLDILTGWRILSLEHVAMSNELAPQHLVHAEWRVVAEKPDE